MPVWGDRGRQGGFQLREGWRTQLIGLTAGEAQALFMAGLPGPAKDLGLQDAAASVHLKLIAALPADWQRDAERARRASTSTRSTGFAAPRRPTI